MNNENIICPVCTLYLRPGITLKSHLSSHPKQKVIEALVRVSYNEGTKKKKSQDLAISQSAENSSGSAASNTNGNCNSQPLLEQGPAQSSNSLPQQNLNVIPGNHSFIYQQFMSTSSQQSSPAILNGNPIAPQYITIPTVFSPQMVCSPYLYQQQQVIMSTGPSLPPLLPKPVTTNLPNSTQSSIIHSAPTAATASSASVNSFQDKTSFVVVEKRTSGDASAIRPSSRSSSSSLIISPIPNSPSENSSSSQVSMSPVYSPESQLGVMKDEGQLDSYKKEQNESDGQNQYVNEITDIPDNRNYNQNDADNCDDEDKKSDFEENSIKIDYTKACQTQQVDHEEDIQLEEIDYYEADVTTAPQGNSENPAVPNYYNTETVITSDNIRATNHNNYDLPEPIFTVSNTFDGEDQGNIGNLDNINIILSSDFIGNQVISRVENFENLNSQEDKRVIMSIGCIDNNNQRSLEHLGDESLSHESENVSIRADEPMPARGELSGQESNGGASDTVWGRLQYDSSRISASYDIIAPETWEVSNGSYTEGPPLQSRNVGNIQYTGDDNEDSPTVVSVIAPPKNFKCSICGEAFKCLKERRMHHREVHREESLKSNSKTKEINVIGSKIGAKKIKKLVIKQKKTENNFDNVFGNKLKTQQENMDETEEDHQSVIMPSSPVKDEEKDEKKIKTETLNCSICDQIFPTFKIFKNHSMVEHNINFDVRRRCAVCEENFSNEADYNQHLQIHPLECRLCGKYFYRKQYMQLHMKRHMGIRPYKCDVCSKAFLTKQKYNEHKNVHTGEAPIKCNMCDETFKRHSNLVQHRNKHHLNIKAKVKDYICFCGEVVHSKKKLAWHKEIHETKPKACLYCPEKFIHTASLTRHMRRAHNQHYVPDKERNSENVECPICKRIYLRSSLDAHIRSHSGQKPYTCPICNKDFTTKWNLKLHKWTHASRSSKPYKCDQCKGAFIRESEYTAHMNSHKSVRPYTCNHCGAQFIRKYNCQRHVKEHMTGKSFSCTICGKTFHRSYYLKDHIRVHNGMRPYACHICGKTSSTKSNHNKHIRIHHAREPVSTEN